MAYIQGYDDPYKRQSVLKPASNVFEVPQGSKPIYGSGSVVDVSTAKPTVSYGNKSNQSSKYSSSMLSSSSNAEKKLKEKMEKQKKEAEKQKQKNISNASSKYNQLMSWIEEKQPLAEEQKIRALESVDAEMQNLTTKADLGKQNIEAQYGDTESQIRSEKESLDKDLARIFEGRNVMDSSYFIKEKQKADDRFLQTLQKLGGEKSRQLASYDADIAYYQKQAIDKRSEIEQAYNETIRAIQQDLTKTGWEKEDAISRLEQEYSDKKSIIEDKILQYSMQQQEFRNSVMQWQADYDMQFAKTAGTAKNTMSVSEKKYQDTLKKQENPTGMVADVMNQYGVDYDTAQKIVSNYASSAKKKEDEQNQELSFDNL